MTSFADKLLAASEDESLSPAELRAFLRRAAIRLQEHEAGAAIDRLTNINEIRARQGLPELGIEAILDDWAIGHGDMPFDDIDEDTETRGSA